MTALTLRAIPQQDGTWTGQVLLDDEVKLVTHGHVSELEALRDADGWRAWATVPRDDGSTEPRDMSPARLDRAMSGARLYGGRRYRRH